MESPCVLVLLTFTENSDPAEVVGTVSSGLDLAESSENLNVPAVFC